jgi:hypothetical protein
VSAKILHFPPRLRYYQGRVVLSEKEGKLIFLPVVQAKGSYTYDETRVAKMIEFLNRVSSRRKDARGE